MENGTIKKHPSRKRRTVTPVAAPYFLKRNAPHGTRRSVSAVRAFHRTWNRGAPSRDAPGGSDGSGPRWERIAATRRGRSGLCAGSGSGAVRALLSGIAPLTAGRAPGRSPAGAADCAPPPIISFFLSFFFNVKIAFYEFMRVKFETLSTPQVTVPGYRVTDCCGRIGTIYGPAVYGSAEFIYQ